MSFTSTPIHLFLLLSYGKKPRLVKPLIIDYIPKYGLFGFGYQVLDIARVSEVVYRSGITASGYQGLDLVRTLLGISRISPLPSYQSIRVVEVIERVSGIVPRIEYYQALELARTLFETARLRAVEPSYQVTKLAEILEKISYIRSVEPSYQVLDILSALIRKPPMWVIEPSYQVLELAELAMKNVGIFHIEPSYQTTKLAEVTLSIPLGFSADIEGNAYSVDFVTINMTRSNAVQDARFVVITRTESINYVESTSGV